MRRGFLDISFSWIFALLIGGMILFGAIYGVSKFTSIKNTETSAELGTELINLLTPLETGLETAKAISISLPVNSRLSHTCLLSGTFGKEKISLEEKVKGKWTNSEVNISFEDKYLFFPDGLEAKKVFAFSKSFDFPFKVANAVYLFDAEKKYCFVSAPREIKTELKNTNIDVFEFDDCSGDSEIICFEKDSNCDILVDADFDKVTKGDESMYFSGDALMYGAIFSDKDNYECELNRLLKRAYEVSLIYEIKSYNLLKRGCDSSLKTEFVEYRNLIDSFDDSRSLSTMESFVKNMNLLNKNAECSLW